MLGRYMRLLLVCSPPRPRAFLIIGPMPIVRFLPVPVNNRGEFQDSGTRTMLFPPAR